MLNLLFLLTLAGIPVEATARPIFEGPQSLTVECLDGCGSGEATNKVFLPDRFPAVPMEGDEARVRVRFRADGYRSRVSLLHLEPGEQHVPVQLERL